MRWAIEGSPLGMHTLLLILFVAVSNLPRLSVARVIEIEEHVLQNRRLSSHAAISTLGYTEDTDIHIYIDPPGGFKEHALGVFVRATRPGPDGTLDHGRVYYEISNTDATTIAEPTLASPFLTEDSPYIHLFTGFDKVLEKTLVLTAVFNEGVEGAIIYRSPLKSYNYEVEGGDRQNSFAFLVPGVESKGNFLRVALEVKAAARAQSAGAQEFANYYSDQGIGTYPDQVLAINLPTEVLEPLGGFEGGLSIVNNDRHWGILVPYHNRAAFHGYVVRVDLQQLEDKAACLSRMRFERWDRDSQSVVFINGQAEPIESACITVLDLASLHPRAVGFRRGFHYNDTYCFLAPGAHDVAVRLDLGNGGDNFGLLSTKLAPLGEVDPAFGGYSGGFSDGRWACFNPMRQVYGPVGGARSSDLADRFQLRPYHNALLTCVAAEGWDMWNPLTGSDEAPGAWAVNSSADTLKGLIEWMDFGNFMPELRGFSGAVRAGRYAFFAPLASDVHVYAAQLVRVYLGDGHTEWVGDIIRRIRNKAAEGQKLRDIIDVMDISKTDPRLKGFSGCFLSKLVLTHPPPPSLPLSLSPSLPLSLSPGLLLSGCLGTRTKPKLQFKNSFSLPLIFSPSFPFFV